MALGSLQRALVIDDDPIQLELTANFLGQRGIASILRASNGLEAKKRLASAAGLIDIIISDLNMPDFDGVEFLMHLKKQNFAGTLAFVSGASPATANAADGLAKAYQIKYAGFFRKPVNFTQLEAALVAHLGKS